ncbi:family 16 glycosylhydrolase [Sphingomonas sp.]|uniref:family 16 glycosylhydrolase n=1 Tax=Sphingomonas sp. TaxID=28214 RepID=UPI003CC6802D
MRAGAAAALLALATACNAAAGAGQGNASAQPAPPPTGGSFFDGFDRLDTSRWMVSDGWVNGDHQGCAWSRANAYVQGGKLQMTLGRAVDRLRPYRCAEIRTYATLGYGTFEARLRTAAGSGLNTAFFSYVNGVADELDFEFLGRNPQTVQLNYWQHGHGGHESTPALGFDASAAFNNYAFVWGPESARWYVNGRLVREEHGAAIPTTPANLFLSLWSGSGSSDAWLGPLDASRTPVLAEVDWVAFTKAGEHCLFPQSITCAPR